MCLMLVGRLTTLLKPMVLPTVVGRPIDVGVAAVDGSVDVVADVRPIADIGPVDDAQVVPNVGRPEPPRRPIADQAASRPIAPFSQARLSKRRSVASRRLLGAVDCRPPAGRPPPRPGVGYPDCRRLPFSGRLPPIPPNGGRSPIPPWPGRLPGLPPFPGRLPGGRRSRVDCRDLRQDWAGWPGLPRGSAGRPGWPPPGLGRMLGLGRGRGTPPGFGPRTGTASRVGPRRTGIGPRVRSIRPALPHAGRAGRHIIAGRCAGPGGTTRRSRASRGIPKI